MKKENIFKILMALVIIAGFNMQAWSQSRYFDDRYIYTQANLNPQLINPGAVGWSQDHNILVNYRNKWAGIDGSPRTITLSYNGPVGNRLGVGVNILDDRFGELGTFKGAAGVSYNIVSESNQVGFGISAEYLKHSLLGYGNSDPTDPLINLGLKGKEYFDASFGLYGIYQGKLTYGLVLPSLISARIDEIDTVEPSREFGFILQAGYKIEVHPDISITPNIIMKKLNNVPSHIDFNLNFGFLQDKLVAGVNYNLGADKRLGFLIGTKIENFSFYYSYNTSSQLIQNYNDGSHELTFGVNFGGNSSK